MDMAINKTVAPQTAETEILIVDLDGTLVKTDLLHETCCAVLGKGRHSRAGLLHALYRGKTSFKAALAETACLDYSLLPYDASILARIKQARSAGSKIYLAAANDRHGQGVAGHLQLFDDVFTIGSAIPFCPKTRKTYAIGAKPAFTRALSALGIAVERPSRTAIPWRVWLKALRIHQYAKNILIFVPMLTAHSVSFSNLLRAGTAFIIFSLCASAVYLLNDLVDLEADRRHPIKCRRPFASGAIPVSRGIAVMTGLVFVSFAAAAALSSSFMAVLGGYFILTTAYSLSLKRKLLLDIVTLAMLYTLRIIAGGAVLSIVISEWLLAFSGFIFICLALIKRYVELATHLDRESLGPSNRDYRPADLPIIGALAAASGFNAVTIFALYISSATVKDMYRRPELLWLICPILLYWLGRTMILAHRRMLNDDPIIFALRDKVSYLAGGLMIAALLLAI